MIPSAFLKTVKDSIDKISLPQVHQLSELVGSARGKIIILGNGGSNAIASHIAEDYTKALKKPSLCFSDSARLTCYANDYGYENAYRQFLTEFAEKDGLIILISSSGNSENIIRCARHCIVQEIPFISLSGFSPDNKLKTVSDGTALINFWVDSTDYGVVECMHEIFLHSII
jgi:D-sedoheptulose 7-phosphate isomerase